MWDFGPCASELSVPRLYSHNKEMSESFRIVFNLFTEGDFLFSSLLYFSLRLDFVRRLVFQKYKRCS